MPSGHLVVKYARGHITFHGMLQHVVGFCKYSRYDLGGINVFPISAGLSERPIATKRPLERNESCHGSLRVCVYLLYFCDSSHAIWVVVR